MTDGSAFEGYLGGTVGSWEGIFYNLYVNTAGDAGFFYGALSGDVDGTLGATGRVTQDDPIVLNTGIAPEALADALVFSFESIEDAPRFIPVFGNIDVDGIIDPTDGVLVSGDWMLLETGGSLLGVWGLTTEDGIYNGPGLETWYPIYGDYEPFSYYMLGAGNITGTDNLVDRVGIAGSLLYLDTRYLGRITMLYRGVYDDFGNYQSAGVGGFKLDPLAFSGMINLGGFGGWDGRDFVSVSPIEGLIGGTN